MAHTIFDEGTIPDPRRLGNRVGGALALLILLLAAFVVFSSDAARRSIHGNSVMLKAEAVLGANHLALSTAEQAVVMAELHRLGIVDRASVQSVIDDADRAIETLAAESALLSAQLDEDTSDIENAADSATGMLGSVVALAEDGKPTEAESLLMSGEPALAELDAAVAATSEDAASSVAVADGLLGSLLVTSALLIGFVVLAGAIAVFRLVARLGTQTARQRSLVRLRSERRVQQARADLIAGISHQLRTPITSIYGFSELLLERGLVDRDTALELVGIINMESSELSRMVDDLLVSARIDAGRLSYDLHPVSLCHELDSVLRPYERSDAEISVDCLPVTVLADPMRLRQVLRNLIANAIHHGGALVEVSTRISGNRVICSVVDDGSGVPPELEDVLFERFIHRGRTSLTVGSIGMGLYIAKSLVTDMGGTIEYVRVHGLTVFRFTLPLESSELPEPPVLSYTEQPTSSDSAMVGGRVSLTMPMAGGGGGESVLFGPRTQRWRTGDTAIHPCDSAVPASHAISSLVCAGNPEIDCLPAGVVSDRWTSLRRGRDR